MKVSWRLESAGSLMTSILCALPEWVTHVEIQLVAESEGFSQERLLQAIDWSRCAERIETTALKSLTIDVFKGADTNSMQPRWSNLEKNIVGGPFTKFRAAPREQPSRLIVALH